eukprot:tig00001264_g7876.t1
MGSYDPDFDPAGGSGGLYNRRLHTVHDAETSARRVHASAALGSLAPAEDAAAMPASPSSRPAAGQRAWVTARRATSDRVERQAPRAAVGPREQRAAAEESEAELRALYMWRFARQALEYRPAAATEMAQGSPRRGRRGFFANARALALLFLVPALSTALQFALPYHSISNRFARFFVLGVMSSFGAGLNGALWFATLLRVPHRKVVPSYMTSVIVLSALLFAALDAALDLSRIPFGSLSILAFYIPANQLAARAHARLIFRRVSTAPASSVYTSGASDAAGGDAAAAGDAVPAGRDPARAFSGVGKFQAVNISVLFFQMSYLFLFSALRSPVFQVAINLVVSSVSFLVLLAQLRLFGGSLLASLPHGDAAGIHVVSMLLLSRVFRQLAFFRVQSVWVYLAGLATDLLALLLPSSLLLRRFARPFARRAVLWLRARSGSVFGPPAAAPQGGPHAEPAPAAPPSASLEVIPAPAHSSLAGPRRPSRAGVDSCALVIPHDEAGGGGGKRAAGVFPQAPAGARDSVLVEALDEPSTSPRPGALREGPHAPPPPSLDKAPPVPPAPAPDPDTDPDLHPSSPSDENLWVYNVQHGIRTMLLWYAVVTWAASAIFVSAVVVARWGPASEIYPYSPAVFSEADCASAIFFSLLTAGVTAAVVAALSFAASFFPGLRDHLGLAPSWRFLREHAKTLGFTFCTATHTAAFFLNRKTLMYYFVFPEAYSVISSS